jgi:hypothetical protein
MVQHGHAAAGMEEMEGAGVDPEALAEITRTVQVEMAQQVCGVASYRCDMPDCCQLNMITGLTRRKHLAAWQLKMITEEMARLKSELYSEHGGLGEIQKQLETLKSNPLMR